MLINCTKLNRLEPHTWKPKIASSKQKDIKRRCTEDLTISKMQRIGKHVRPQLFKYTEKPAKEVALRLEKSICSTGERLKSTFKLKGHFLRRYQMISGWLLSLCISRQWSIMSRLAGKLGHEGLPSFLLFGCCQFPWRKILHRHDFVLQGYITNSK